MTQQTIYMDNAATTPVSESVLKAMLPYFCTEFGNASSLYAAGRRARRALEAARDTAASCLGAQPDEIFFTSGGSESDNWAIKSTARMLKQSGKNHIVTSAFEHPAVLRSCEALKREGFSTTYLPVHQDGFVRTEDLEAALRENTALVSVMYANNEVGTIQPVRKIGEICRRRGVLFHTDAVQAAGILPIDLQNLKADLMSLSAHKFHGPKGVGLLFVRRGLRLPNLIDGGAQERGMRAGTQNVAGAVGLAVALKEACGNREANFARLTALRNQLIDGILKIEGSALNGGRENRLPGNVNVCFEGVDGETLLLLLDQQGICASSGSACSAGSRNPSHVLKAMGVADDLASGSLRLTLGPQNTEEDVAKLLSVLPAILKKIRSFGNIG